MHASFYFEQLQKAERLNFKEQTPKDKISKNRLPNDLSLDQVIEKDAETDRKKAVIEAEKEAQVAKIK